MNILITAIGGDIAQSISKILREIDFIDKIIGTDSDQLHAGRFFVDSFYEIPQASSINFIAELTEIIKKEVVDYIIPVNEKEILNIYQYLINNSPNNLSNRIILPKTTEYPMLFNKLKAYSLLKMKDDRIELPWTIESNQEPLNFPCIFKKQESSGSKSLRTITREIYIKHKDELVDGIFQEYLFPEDEEYTCGVYRSYKTKKTFVVILKRKLKGGLTGYAEVVADDEIRHYCEKIANAIELQGSINIQLIKTINGPKLLEINPRFSSTVYFRHKIGFEDLFWCIMEKKSEDYEINFNEDLAIGKKFYRVFTEIVE